MERGRLRRGANSRRGWSGGSLNARGHWLCAGGECGSAFSGIRAAEGRRRQVPKVTRDCDFRVEMPVSQWSRPLAL